MPDRRALPRKTSDSPIARARIAAGLTQAQLADRLGIGQATLRRWETGETSPSAAKLKALAQALETGMDKLV